MKEKLESIARARETTIIDRAMILRDKSNKATKSDEISPLQCRV
jgi:hypothetical protein